MITASVSKTAKDHSRMVDQQTDRMLSELGITDDRDAIFINHWQDEPKGSQLQVTRRRDRASRICFCPYEPE